MGRRGEGREERKEECEREWSTVEIMDIKSELLYCKIK
jgi:hypothetical protein